MDCVPLETRYGVPFRLHLMRYDPCRHPFSHWTTARVCFPQLQRWVIFNDEVRRKLSFDSPGMTAGSPRVPRTTAVPAPPPTPAPMAAPLPPPAIAPITAPAPAPIPIFLTSFFFVVLAFVIYALVEMGVVRPSAKVNRLSLTLNEATPLTRPPGSELTITPSTVAPF